MKKRRRKARERRATQVPDVGGWYDMDIFDERRRGRRWDFSKSSCPQNSEFRLAADLGSRGEGVWNCSSRSPGVLVPD